MPKPHTVSPRVSPVLFLSSLFLLLFLLRFLLLGFTFRHFPRRLFPSTATTCTCPSAAKVHSLFHPLTRPALFASRMAHPCLPGRVPAASQLTEYPYSSPSWNVDRFIAYYNLFPFLTHFFQNLSSASSPHLKTDTTATYKPKVLDFGKSHFLDPFNTTVHIIRTHYYDTDSNGPDIHGTKFEDGTFDAVASDQVLEHVAMPHVAMLEVHRILKPGGIAIFTTVAFNPLHNIKGPRGFDDFWRFMPDGLKVLSMPFENGIKLCGSWGNEDVIAFRTLNGLASAKEAEFYVTNRTQLLTARNNPEQIMLVWLVVQK